MYSRSYSWTLLGTVWLGLAQNHEYIKSLTLCSSRSLYKSYGKIILEAKSSLDILFGPRSNFFWYTSITRNGAPCSSHWRSCKEGSKHHNIRGLMKGKYRAVLFKWEVRFCISQTAGWISKCFQHQIAFNIWEGFCYYHLVEFHNL